MQPSSCDEQLRIRAYYLWESEGRPGGRDDEFWSRAEQMLDSEKLVTALIDEATAAGALLAKVSVNNAPLTPAQKRENAAPNDVGHNGAAAAQSAHTNPASTPRKAAAAEAKTRAASPTRSSTTKTSDKAGSDKKNSVRRKKAEPPHT
ncbi:MAG: DUF2934 domain-containing protein [Paraburkholderia sp.]|uniref:DUF2934 domain-containing protein n=1 Tax=Paraburkholderia sp. TaxID=1926495 RepID=UPI003C46C34D